jgi:hypothetical protein
MGNKSQEITMQRFITLLLVVLGTALAAGSVHADIGHQLFKLSDGAAFDEFGNSVAIAGAPTTGDTIAVIGSFLNDFKGTDAGSAYLYNVTTGVQIAGLLAGDGHAGDNFGYSVAITDPPVENQVVVVGAPLDDDKGTDSGSVYLFDATGNPLTPISKIVVSEGQAGDNFGYSVAIDAVAAKSNPRIIVVGAPFDDDNGADSGSVYLFNTETGEPPAIFCGQLIPDDGAAFDNFGFSVAFSGDVNTVAVGAPFHDHNGTDSGAVYVFDINYCSPTDELLPDDGAGFDAFGYSVALYNSDTPIIVVGAPFDDDNGTDSGSAYIFKMNQSGDWIQIAKLLPDDGAAFDEFGYSVALNDTIAIVGSRRNDVTGSNSGAVYVFGVDTGEQFEKILPEDGAMSDEFGNAVAINDSVDGQIAIVGAHLDDDNGTDSGSAYVFDASCPADFNGDTVIDSLDYIAFLNAFTAGDPSADYNNDGVVDSKDFIAFLNDFYRGC